jgi:hypothetical protein
MPSLSRHLFPPPPNDLDLSPWKVIDPTRGKEDQEIL